LVLVLLTCAAWARAVSNPLVPSWDDGHFLDPEANPTLVPSPGSFVSAWSEIRFDAYQPLHLLSYWIDVPWLGASGPVVHTTNLVLWLGVVLLLARALERLGLSLAASTAAAAVFAVHPTAIEIVGWGTGRKDLVALLFTLGALHAHLHSRGPWDRAAWWSRALFTLAMLGKTASAPLPLVLFALDVWCARRSPREAATQRLRPRSHWRSVGSCSGSGARTTWFEAWAPIRRRSIGRSSPPRSRTTSGWRSFRTA
jgi:hypothetical protein